jgi:hypothetical protein
MIILQSLLRARVPLSSGAHALRFCLPLPLRLRTAAAALATAASCSALLVASINAYAQSPMPSTPHTPQNRVEAAGSAPDPSGATVHESQAPQAKDAKGAKKGSSAGSKSQSSGAGGFNNGLYGTGAGSNK